jgi:chaperonin GroES
MLLRAVSLCRRRRSKKPQQGIVVSVGAGHRNENGKLITVAVKVDDKVLFARYSGAEVKINSKKVLILKEADILAVVTS